MLYITSRRATGILSPLQVYNFLCAEKIVRFSLKIYLVNETGTLLTMPRRLNSIFRIQLSLMNIIEVRLIIITTRAVGRYYMQWEVSLTAASQVGKSGTVTCRSITSKI